ncbi:MAG: beta-ketoacyl-[acyl-carrier-protein] synthase family protein, partial [Methanobacterium sp.]|nr:beta-ketoacyl-[acyl-carrier-protein] synthase family protein [Methanobacterium sp.]
MIPVAVTGMGWTTALGSCWDAVWRDLLDGRSAIGPVETALPLRN